MIGDTPEEEIASLRADGDHLVEENKQLWKHIQGADVVEAQYRQKVAELEAENARLTAELAEGKRALHLMNEESRAACARINRTMDRVAEGAATLLDERHALRQEVAQLRQQLNATRPYLEAYLQNLMVDEGMVEATEAERQRFLAEEKQALLALFRSLEH